MSWARPVPLVGDASSAAERGADPMGWAFSPEDRDAFYAVVAGRRDIRRFRSDPVPVEVLHRVLGAAHAAPSVGHSQPWRFVVVQSSATRDRAALMADRERSRQAAGMDDDDAHRLLDLQLEGIREAPLGLVVCCDRRARPEGVLGRATFVDADLWSCACAIQNLWLAARAEGLGVGWVTLFRPDELAAMLGLPVGVDTLGWLCVGWPDERPPEPGLARAGWSTRQPLDDVVIQEHWPTRSPPPPVSKVRAPGPESVVGARDGADDLLTPLGSLGVLDRAVDRLTALGIAADAPVCAVVAGADHPITRYGVSTFPDSVTREVLEATVAGESLGATTARSIGADLVIVDAGVRGAPVSGALSIRPLECPGDLVGSDALAAAEARRLLAAGRRIGLGLGPGLVALGEVGMGNTTVAAALAAAQLGLDVPEVLGLGVGGDSATLERKGGAIGKALSRARLEHGPRLSDPLCALAALGGPEIAVLAGVALGAAEAGCLVVLDGLATSVATVAAVGLEPAVAAHLVAGQRSRERAHHRVLTYLGIEPLLTLRLRAGEGVGAMLAVQMLRTAATMRRDIGRVAPRARGQKEGQGRA
jgi:nicotinate-nucleotide--dimethylbenzimidazole phosphoribosyltransferase